MVPGVRLPEPQGDLLDFVLLKKPVLDLAILTKVTKALGKLCRACLVTQHCVYHPGLVCDEECRAPLTGLHTALLCTCPKEALVAAAQSPWHHVLHSLKSAVPSEQEG